MPEPDGQEPETGLPEPEPQRPRSGRPVWTGSWWRDARGRPRPLQLGGGEWIQAESDLAADQWDPLLWRRIR